MKKTEHVLNWNCTHNHWETHSLDMPLRVSENQCLLYKITRDITAIFDDIDCLELAEEFALTHAPGQCMVRDDYIHMTNPSEQDSPCPVPSKHLNAPPSLSPPRQPSKRPASHILLSPSPHHPKWKHKKGQCKSQLSCATRRWPTDFYIVEVASGLKFIEANQHQQGVTNTIGVLYKEYYGQEST